MALGCDRIDLLSESAGDALRDGLRVALPEEHPPVGHGRGEPPGNFVWNARTTDEQIRRYSTLCAKDESCSRRTDDLVATIRRVNSDMPKRWGFLPIDAGNVRLEAFYGLFESSMDAAGLAAGGVRAPAKPAPAAFPC